jgi:chromosome segregation ATPase
MSEQLDDRVAAARRRAPVDNASTVNGALDSAQTSMSMVARTGADVERFLSSIEADLQQLKREGRRVRQAQQPAVVYADARGEAGRIAGRLAILDAELSDMGGRLNRASDALTEAQASLRVLQETPGQYQRSAEALEGRAERMELAVNTARSGTEIARARVETAHSILVQLANNNAEVDDRAQAVDQVVDASQDVRQETDDVRRAISGARVDMETQQPNIDAAIKQSQALVEAVRAATVPPVPEEAQQPGSASEDQRPASSGVTPRGHTLGRD